MMMPKTVPVRERPQEMKERRGKRRGCNAMIKVKERNEGGWEEWRRSSEQ